MPNGRAILLATLLGLALIGGLTARGHAQDRASATQPSVKRDVWGRTPDGMPVSLYTLRGAGGMTVRITDYGATLVAIEVPDRNGASSNVILGFQDLAGYLKNSPFFGATVGRVSNRIAKGKLTLDGKEYTLAVNNGPNHLHGGKKGFDKFVWSGEPIEGEGAEGPAIRFTRRSPDGEEGYPGTLDASVTFTLTPDNAVHIDYAATTDTPTPINLTNHAYFNLAGVDGPTVEPILDHVMQIHADRFLPVDDTMVPTGDFAPVAGTPMDFRQPTSIGQRIAEVPGMKNGGYDHCYVIDGGGQGKFVPVATVIDPKSGRRMDVLSTEPGVQFYTANFRKPTVKGKGGGLFANRAAFCLETQHFPDSPNQPKFPSIILRPGEAYRSTTVYRFSLAP